MLKAETMNYYVPLARLLLKATLSFSTLGLVIGCGGSSDEVSDSILGSYLDEPDNHTVVSHSVGAGVLALVNDSLTDVPFLKHECLIDLGAAERIVAHRQGPDGLDATADDDMFDNLTELDDVGLVGEQTMVLLGEAAERLGLVPVLELEGIPFTQDEIDNTLELVNSAPLEVLDIDAAIDVRAAQSLVYGRPFEDLLEVADRPFVGPSALTSLKWFASSWIDSLE